MHAVGALDSGAGLGVHEEAPAFGGRAGEQPTFPAILAAVAGRPRIPDRAALDGYRRPVAPPQAVFDLNVGLAAGVGSLEGRDRFNPVVGDDGDFRRERRFEVEVGLDGRGLLGLAISRADNGAVAVRRDPGAGMRRARGANEKRDA